jgi:DNA-damage-inducible protein J
MANKENLTLRIDPELKKEASALFKSLGLDLSTATGIFYRQALRTKGLPFPVVLEVPNKTTHKAMKEAEEGKNMVGPFDTVDDLMKDLNAKD